MMAGANDWQCDTQFKGVEGKGAGEQFWLTSLLYDRQTDRPTDRKKDLNIHAYTQTQC